MNECGRSSGSFITRHTTPDELTKWYVAAMSLHPYRGLQVSNVVQIIVTNDLYLSVYIPTLVYKCNETVNSAVYVHNTKTFEIIANVTMLGKDTFKVDGTQRGTSITKVVKVPAQSSGLATFTLQFVTVGVHNVTVSAVSNDGRRDAIQKSVSAKVCTCYQNSIIFI